MTGAVVLGSGLAGWRFLQRTADAQVDRLARAPQPARDVAAFRDRIGAVRTAETLVSDRQLLSVAAGAFGLGEDIGNRFFLKRILEDGTARPDALANRLSDQRYRAFSAAFGFGDPGGPRTGWTGFADGIVARYERKLLETSVGETDNDLRLALNADDRLAEIAASGSSDAARWFRIMGEPPLRSVVETALGLPSEFGRLDLDRQLSELQRKAGAVFGRSDAAQFADPETRNRLIDTFLLRRQVAGLAAAGPSQIALGLVTQVSASMAASRQAF